MGHPMEDYWLGESMARDRASMRRDKVLEALKDVKLSEFTVGQLSDLVQLVRGGLVTRDGFHGEALERLEKFVEDHHRVFKHGMRVRYRKVPDRKNPRGVGVITSRPRKGTRLVHVEGPRGWAGWASVDELDIVPP